MKQIPLTKGKFALVDDRWFEYLNQWKWCISSDGYAVRNTSRLLGKRETIRMHRVIMGISDDTLVDHINHNKVDNQESNLRLCSVAENLQNQRAIRGGVSRYKGVDFFKPTGKWRALIKANDKRIHLGLFDDEIDAARAYDTAAREYFGEFAHTNF